MEYMTLKFVDHSAHSCVSRGGQVTGKATPESQEFESGAQEGGSQVGSDPIGSVRAGSPESGSPETLRLVLLTSGVILPGMVFTLALETDEARAGVEASGPGPGLCALVPRRGGRYSRAAARGGDPPPRPPACSRARRGLRRRRDWTQSARLPFEAAARGHP